MPIDVVKLATAVKAAKDDPEKAKQMAANPKQYLQDQGLDVPEGIAVDYEPGSRSCGCYEVGAGAHLKAGWPG